MNTSPLNNSITFTNTGSEVITVFYCLLPNPTEEGEEKCNCEALKTMKAGQVNLIERGNDLKFATVPIRPKSQKSITICPYSSVLLSVKLADIEETAKIDDFTLAVSGSTKEKIHLVVAGTRGFHPVVVEFNHLGKRNLKKQISALGLNRLQTVRITEEQESDLQNTGISNLAGHRLKTKVSKEVMKPSWIFNAGEVVEMGKEIVKGVAVELAQDKLTQILGTLVLGG
ncbi:hypothetical protein HDV06_005477 [Boothiomyces sp. JEL0866]|nr:hypothetical protein HDV06_005477 [Boothiomyces sp. JEL0866]